MKTTKKAVSQAILKKFGLRVELYKVEGIYYWVSDEDKEGLMLAEWDTTCTHCVRLDQTVEWFVDDFASYYNDWKSSIE